MYIYIYVYLLYIFWHRCWIRGRAAQRCTPWRGAHGQIDVCYVYYVLRHRCAPWRGAHGQMYAVCVCYVCYVHTDTDALPGEVHMGPPWACVVYVHRYSRILFPQLVTLCALVCVQPERNTHVHVGRATLHVHENQLFEAHFISRFQFFQPRKICCFLDLKTLFYYFLSINFGL